MAQEHRTIRTLPYSPEQMFDLVSDVRRYPEFLPWVVATRIHSDSDALMTADMLVGFKGVREKFTSHVHKQRPNRIFIEYLDGPMRHLESDWHFQPDSSMGIAKGCRIDFTISFAFRSSFFERVAGVMFERAMHRMVKAFETRAHSLYSAQNGSNAKNPQASPSLQRIPPVTISKTRDSKIADKPSPKEP